MTPPACCYEQLANAFCVAFRENGSIAASLKVVDLVRVQVLKKAARANDQAVFDAVAAHTGIPASIVAGTGKRRDIVAARWLVFAAMRAQGRTLVEIGTATGVHHTAVLHALRLFDARGRGAELTAVMATIEGR